MKVKKETILAISFIVGFICGYYANDYPQIFEKVIFYAMYIFAILGLLSTIVIIWILIRDKNKVEE